MQGIWTIKRTITLWRKAYSDWRWEKRSAQWDGEATQVNPDLQVTMEAEGFGSPRTGNSSNSSWFKSINVWSGQRQLGSSDLGLTVAAALLASQFCNVIPGIQTWSHSFCTPNNCELISLNKYLSDGISKSKFCCSQLKIQTYTHFLI